MRTTITISDKVFRALKMRAAETDASISQLVEDAAKRKGEPAHSFDDLVAQFKVEGLL
jgi:predicted CopG family antitoxin